MPGMAADTGNARTAENPQRPAPMEATASPGPPTEAGDTLCRYAGRYGVDPEALRSINGLELGSRDPLPPGQVLLIPRSRPARYRVQSGDNVISLSRHFGVSVGTLARLNDLDDANQLRAGDWLTLPAGTATACPPLPAVSAAPPSSSEPEAAQGQADADADADSREASLAHAATSLTAAEALYDRADFSSALGLIDVARFLLAPLPSDAEVEELTARASWLSGLSLVGLGRREEALGQLRDALQRDPSMADSSRVSPRIEPLLEAAQSQAP